MNDKSLFSSKGLLFADGAHGSAMQIHGIYAGTDKQFTGILMVWSRKDRKDFGTRRWYYKDFEYPEFRDARYAWRHDGEPTVDEESGSTLTRFFTPSKFKKAEPEEATRDMD